ncbi:beta strand repeat-containing protein [uncultured Winogradskyella sp.]|uniref:beta strand repeat-containing protein n=1 Tax=uncultured Winogradskyella sp. TaxID=395353 RepID=UPI0035150F48
MMKTLSKLLSLAIIAGLLMMSCNDDDDNGGGQGPGSEANLNGTITSDRTLDPNVQYTISGSVLVADGVTLTIPAGTEIVSQQGTDKYIAVLKGGSIDIQGTAGSPVVMRSNGVAGSWGGLVICGDATTTEGANATAEVGGLVYGGDNDSDDSGDIEYLIIRDAGAQINADSQFNGLSLYAVGSGTNINNVAIINGTDDGIEFFGGTVSVSNIYLENNEDDSIDWTEGWSGSINTAYVTQTIDNFSTVIESDGVNNNPTINNLTAISSTGGLAIQVKNASGGTINGFTATGYDDLFDFPGTSGPGDFIIDGAGSNVADDAVYASSQTNASQFSWATTTDITDNVLPSNIVTDTQLDPSIQYRIVGPVLVNSNATLTIPAGTEIVSNSGTANYLAVLQGGDINIQGSPGNPVVMRSDDGLPWGGLLLCGNATTTEGVNATAEVGGLVYGGTNDNDSSGSIEYLILRNTGAQINADSQFNGLSLYAVGDGTSIDNVAVISGADDGIEFFGGTVNVTNFYAENIEDDAIDWTEGWNGTLSTAYVVNTIQDFSTAIEADGVNANPTIENLTAISSTGGLAIQMKNASGATINGFTATGFTDLFDFPGTSGPAELQIDGADADTAADAVYASSQTNASNFAWATDGIDSEVLPANITSDLTLDASVEYIINGPVLVNSGATLTIPAGTTIVSNSGTANYLAVLQGGAIDIQGEMSNPVEMRSADGLPWGGLLLCGNAPTTEGVNATAEVGGLVYGGTDENDSSGNIDYLILVDTGAQINADSQFNGLSLYAVGDGTTIDNVAIIRGADDGIEFFGGTVNVTGFYAEDVEDDSVDWTEGWNGTLTDTFIKQGNVNFSTAVEADGAPANPTLVNFAAISTVGGTGIQMKNASNATMMMVTLSGFDEQFDFPGTSGPADLQVNGANANEGATYNAATIQESDFAWINN